MHVRRQRPTAESAEGVWRSRRVSAAVLRVVAVGGPIALGMLTGKLVVDAFAAGTDRWLVVLVALAAASVVSLVAARLGMRLLPLAVLLKMTMVFPDRAPSRLKVARRATSHDELQQRLADPDADARETAATLLALVTALGRHDRKTRGHSERVRLFCDLIGTQLGLSEADRGRLRWVGLLHDIGKLEVAATVLNKPSQLDADEWVEVRKHPDHGARLAHPLAQWLGPWYDGIAHHHERYDGMGYPNGLAGTEISYAGRAVSVVDAFETMTAARSYKSPMTTAAARAELTRCAGSHFDPVMVRAFLAIALPRLLWTMGPLTFVVNAPFLHWISAASARATSFASAGVGAASNAVGVTAVSVALVAGQSAITLDSAPHHHAEAASYHAVAATAPGTTAPRTDTAQPPRSGSSAARPATSAAPTPTPSPPATTGSAPTTAPSPADAPAGGAVVDPVVPRPDQADPVTQPSTTPTPAASPDSSATASPRPADPSPSPTPSTPAPAVTSSPPSSPASSSAATSGKGHRPSVPPVPPGLTNRTSTPPGQANRPSVPPVPPGQDKTGDDDSSHGGNPHDWSRGHSGK